MVRRQGLAKERTQNIEMRLWGSCLHINEVSWANKPVVVLCDSTIRTEWRAQETTRSAGRAVYSTRAHVRSSKFEERFVLEIVC